MTGAIVPGFGNAMEAMMAGQIGNTLTLNGSVPKPVPVRAGESLRRALRPRDITAADLSKTGSHG